MTEVSTDVYTSSLKCGKHRIFTFSAHNLCCTRLIQHIEKKCIFLFVKQYHPPNIWQNSTIIWFLFILKTVPPSRYLTEFSKIWIFVYLKKVSPFKYLTKFNKNRMNLVFCSVRWHACNSFKHSLLHSLA